MSTKSYQPKKVYGRDNPNYTPPSRANHSQIDSDTLSNPRFNNTSQTNYGITQKGTVKRTSGQIKRHYTSMSEEEMELIYDKILDDYELKEGEVVRSRHLISKGNCSFTDEEYEDVIYDGELIEINRTHYGEYRALMRGKDTPAYIDGNHTTGNLCTVICIQEGEGEKGHKLGEIVTAYWNKSGDNHESYDKNRYDNSLELPSF